MRAPLAPAALLLLLLLAALTLAATPAAAQTKHNRGVGQTTQCRFGWVPVTFDRNPKQQLPLKPNRRPREKNLRCSEACFSLGLTAVMTTDQDRSLQKPLCYFERKRVLGAAYKIYGSWYPGEAADDYESTCRGRTETGQPTAEYAMSFNETTLQMQFGFYCGCSGCTQGCYNSAPRATPRDAKTGRINCSAPAPGTLPPYPRAGKYWPYYFTGPEFAANTNPNSTAPGACNDPRFKGGANNFPYPICKGRTAVSGEEWGTMDNSFTCNTFSSLVVASPSFFCTINPGVKTAFPPPAVSGKSMRLMGALPSSRLDLVMGASEPVHKRPAVLTQEQGMMP